MKNIKLVVVFAVVLMGLGSCLKNKEIVHPDFDYQTVYFATQFPVRTLVLGEDMFVDNSLDNEKKISIKATTGGVRQNRKDLDLEYVVEPSLCNNLFFSSAGAKITPLPSTHYSMLSNTIKIPSGSLLGGVDVQLTDAFFNDPLALSNNYAIPVLLSGVKSGDSILRGKPSVANPNRFIDAHWVVKPRDFVIYAIKFVNTWHGNYLRRGTDVVTGSVNSTINRRMQYVEQDEVRRLTTKSLKSLDFPITIRNSSGGNINVTLLLSFDDSGNCTITSSTSDIAASGTGKFVKKGEKKSWGNIDRDALYLDYSINIPLQNIQVKTMDTLVMRDRAVVAETFTPVIK